MWPSKKILIVIGTRPEAIKMAPLVHGDTSTSMAASLAAFYLNVKVGHIEAGLRTYNIHSPFLRSLIDK